MVSKLEAMVTALGWNGRYGWLRRWMLKEHAEVRRLLVERGVSMRFIVEAAVKQTGNPPVGRQHAWRVWKSVQEDLAKAQAATNAASHVYAPPAPRPKPAPIAAPAPPAPASRPGRPPHPSKILRDDDDPKPRYVHSSKLFD